MIIRQFEDKCLSHYSYAILSEGKIVLVDPERDPQKYYDFAKDNNARITAVVETHPHADFVSSHAEIHRSTGATVYVSKLLSAEYPHTEFDDGDMFIAGKVEFSALNTPGHSPDSICITAAENGKIEAVFTGDTLFIGDCGRPDLREKAGAIREKRNELARQMYHSLREKLMKLPDETLVYPTHGAGSLCGKGLSSQNVSTIGAEKASNWSLQQYTEDNFIKELTSNQPFVPKYFAHAVNVNRKGASDLAPVVAAVPVHNGIDETRDKNIIVIDTRDEHTFKEGFLGNSINLMARTNLETWLGSIAAPGEPFYLIVNNKQEADDIIRRIAKIGYEPQISSVFIASHINGRKMNLINPDIFREHQRDYTIVDIRNNSETSNGKIFSDAITIPLPELRERVSEIPTDKPIVVHCSAGYRSAAGSSIIENRVGDNPKVYDLGTAVKSFILN